MKSTEVSNAFSAVAKANVNAVMATRALTQYKQTPLVLLFPRHLRPRLPASGLARRGDNIELERLAARYKLELFELYARSCTAMATERDAAANVTVDTLKADYLFRVDNAVTFFFSDPTIGARHEAARAIARTRWEDNVTKLRLASAVSQSTDLSKKLATLTTSTSPTAAGAPRASPVNEPIPRSPVPLAARATSGNQASVSTIAATDASQPRGPTTQRSGRKGRGGASQTPGVPPAHSANGTATRAPPQSALAGSGPRHTSENDGNNASAAGAGSPPGGGHRTS